MRIRAELMEVYARRIVASVASDLGAGIASIRWTMFDTKGTKVVVEWLAKLEDDTEIRLSAVVTKGPQEMTPEKPSREQLESLRELGISPEDVGHN